MTRVRKINPIPRKLSILLAEVIMQTSLTEARAAFIQDIRDLVAFYSVNEGMIKDMVISLNTYEDHVKSLLGEPETVPDPEPVPDTALPARSVPKDFSNRTSPYALQGDNLVVEDKELYGVFSACAYLSNSTLRNFLCYGSGGDAIKLNWGDLLLEDGHIHTLGLNQKAHADGIQARGGMGTLTCRRVFFDMPTNLGDNSKSNACVLLQSVTNDNGEAFFEDCIFRGGNYSIVTSDKRSGYLVADTHFKNCQFVVEKDSPRFGLFSLQGDASFDNCEVVAFENGGLTPLTNDPASFNFKSWHQTKYGRKPLS